jgi:hypothetical protein
VASACGVPFAAAAGAAFSAAKDVTDMKMKKRMTSSVRMYLMTISLSKVFSKF